MSCVQLNCMDRYFLANEGPEMRFNHQLVFDFEGTLDLERLRTALRSLMAFEPMARSYVVNRAFGLQRRAAPLNYFGVDQILDVLDDEPFDFESEQNDRPFSLERQPPVRLLVSRQSGVVGWKIISTVHHSAFDGVAHVAFLGRLFSLYNGLDVRKLPGNTPPFRYRSLIWKRGPLWFLRRLQEHTLLLFRKRPDNPLGTLMAHPERHNRKMSVVTLDFQGESFARVKGRAAAQGLTLLQFVVASAAKVYDQMLQARGDAQSSLLFLVPANQRPLLGVRSGNQNVVGLACLPLQREEIRCSDFSAKLDAQFKRESTLEKTVRSAFIPGLLATLGRPASVRRRFAQLDRDPRLVLSSLVVTGGKLPADFPTPQGTQLKRVSARVALLKSPGIGLVLSDYRVGASLACEYISDLFEPGVPQEFVRRLGEVMNAG